MKNSMLSVKDVLQTPGLEGVKVLSGESGLHKQVRTVTIIDAPDAANYIHGGEIILSTLYIWRDNPGELASFIEQVSDNGAVAMGIKLKRFYNVLPEEIVKLSERIDFPIFSYPQNFSFVDIINPVLSRIVNRQADILYRSMEIHRSLTDLSLETSDTGLIIKKLSEIIGTDVAFVDTLSGRSYVTCDDSDLGRDLRRYSVEKLISLYRSEDVSVEGKHYGVILLNANPDPQKTTLLTHNTLMHAKTVLKFKVKRDRLHIQVERKHRDEFILDLLFRNIRSSSEIYSRASIFGWDFSSGVFVIVVTLQSERKNSSCCQELAREKALQLFKARLSDLYPEVIYTSLTDSLVFIVGSDYESYKKDRESLKRTISANVLMILKETGWVSYCGVGTHVKDVIDVSDSFKNARFAIDIARSRASGEENVIFWEEKCLYHFINTISESPEGQNYYRSCLEPLETWDRENNGDFMETLLVISENNWNLRKAAEKLHLHYNTVKYRFSKIRKLLSLDLENEDARLNILLALKIWRIKRSRG